MKIITQLFRVLVGTLFIFSGFIKANDPLGFSYKLEEYFTLFGMGFFADIAVALAIIICVAEIGLGIALLIGSYIKPVSWALLVMILFFTWLTGYSHYTGQVTDCGCFGDAIPLTPWESFLKDIVLTVMIVVIFIFKKYIRPLFSKPFSIKVIALTKVASLGFALYCWYYLPTMNYLKFKKGNNITELLKVPPGGQESPVMEMTFIYSKDGKEHKFKADELEKVDSTYTFVDRIDEVIIPADEPPIHDFHISSKEGVEVTDDFKDKKPGEYTVFIVAYDLSATNKKAFEELATLFNPMVEKNTAMVWALTAAAPAEADAFRTDIQAYFEFLTADATLLKSMIRSNPGVILFNGTTVVDTWPATALPSEKELKKLMQ